jgi:hypothetical protein
MLIMKEPMRVLVKAKECSSPYPKISIIEELNLESTAKSLIGNDKTIVKETKK